MYNPGRPFTSRKIYELGNERERGGLCTQGKEVSNQIVTSSPINDPV